MAVIIATLLGAILVTALFYIGLSVINDRLSLGIRMVKGYVSVSVWATGIFAFLGWCGICLSGWLYENMLMLLLTFFLITGMSILNVTDIEKHIIPNLILKLMIFVWSGLVACFFVFYPEQGFSFLFKSLAGGMAAGVVFFLCYLLSRKQLGAGDVKLVFVMGLYLTGQRIMGAIFYGILLCCIYSIVQLCRKKMGFKDGVPLTPFLYAGTFITLLIVRG